MCVQPGGNFVTTLRRYLSWWCPGERRGTRIILHSEEKLISHGEEGERRGQFIGFQRGSGSRYTWWSSGMVSVLLRAEKGEERRRGEGSVVTLCLYRCWNGSQPQVLTTHFLSQPQHHISTPYFGMIRDFSQC